MGRTHTPLPLFTPTMLIKTPSTTTAPSLKEAVEITRQQNLDRVRNNPLRKPLANQDELMDAVARIGKPMSHTDFIEKVRRLTDGKVRAEEAIKIKYIYGKSMWSFYGPKGEISATVVDAGWIPEYGIITKTDKYGRPTDKKRGWREVLLRLIQEKFLTKRQVLKHFGTPTPTNLDRWDAYTYKFNS